MRRCRRSQIFDYRLALYFSSRQFTALFAHIYMLECTVRVDVIRILRTEKKRCYIVRDVNTERAMMYGLEEKNGFIHTRWQSPHIPSALYTHCIRHCRRKRRTSSVAKSLPDGLRDGIAGVKREGLFPRYYDEGSDKLYRMAFNVFHLFLIIGC